MARRSTFFCLRTLFLISKRSWEIKISLSDSDSDFPEFQTSVEQRFNFNYQQLEFSFFNLQLLYRTGELGGRTEEEEEGGEVAVALKACIVAACDKVRLAVGRNSGLQCGVLM